MTAWRPLCYHLDAVIAGKRRFFTPDLPVFAGCPFRNCTHQSGAGPEDFDGTILVNGVWFIHRRRYRTPENLRTELKSHGFTVLEQSGEVMENAICTHQGYGEPQSLDHEMGEIRCIQANTAGSEQSTKCSSAGVR